MSAAGGPAPAANPAGAPAKAQDTVEIKSPMVGTFYRAAAPEADPFVTIGQEVTEDTTVCIIEAMKVMNEIKAEVRGEVVAVLVENGEPVEFGQPLILLKPIGSASAPSPT
jgi:acetyl-CoA carboxylase biotin carboxyl carrier protein